MNAENLAVNTVMNYIDGLNGRQFEFYVGYFLQMGGCKNIQITQATHDFGIDIFGHYGKFNFGAQCKHRREGLIGYNAIEEAIAGAQFYKLDVPMIVTNRPLTSDAQLSAKRCGVIRITRCNFKLYLKKLYKLHYPDKKSHIINYMFPLKFKLLRSKNPIITAKMANTFDIEQY